MFSRRLMKTLWIFFEISMKWFINAGAVSHKDGSLCDKNWFKKLEILSDRNWKVCHSYQYIGAKQVPRAWWRWLLYVWIFSSILASFVIFHYMNSASLEKRKESLASMCDERARMLQDQFNVSMNHIQALSILISIFHHAKYPSAIDQMKGLFTSRYEYSRVEEHMSTTFIILGSFFKATFAKHAERTAFEKPLTSGVAYLCCEDSSLC